MCMIFTDGLILVDEKTNGLEYTLERLSEVLDKNGLK